MKQLMFKLLSFIGITFVPVYNGPLGLDVIHDEEVELLCRDYIYGLSWLKLRREFPITGERVYKEMLSRNPSDPKLFAFRDETIRAAFPDTDELVSKMVDMAKQIIDLPVKHEQPKKS